MDERPNILLITTDQHRFDAVGFMGHPTVRTPNLDRLAAGGAVFERAYVTSPVCMPSRATLVTGQFPDAHGVRRNGIEIPDAPWGIGRVFRDAGWRTGVFGKTHFGPLRRDYREDAEFHDWRGDEEYYGFEERGITHDLKDFVSDVPTPYTSGRARPEPVRNFVRDDYLDWIAREHPDRFALAVRDGLPPEDQPIDRELWTSRLPAELHQTAWIADQTMAFCDRHRNDAFFAWCSFVDPHHPFAAPQRHRDLYDAATLDEPIRRDGELDRRSRYHRERYRADAPSWGAHWREYRAQYFAMISLIDEQVGRLLDHLAAARLAERTVVVFTADHGEMLGDHGLARKGLFHYEPLIRVPLAVSWPGRVPAGRRLPGIIQSVDLPATLLGFAGVPRPDEYQGVPLGPWCLGERDDAPRRHALVTNGGEGPHYDPWPELRTLVTERWKLQYYVDERRVEIDDLATDPGEVDPPAVDQDPGLVRELLEGLIDAGSAASVWRRQTGRW